MTVLERRLVRLEERFPPIVAPDPLHQLQLEALQKLPMDELQLLQDVVLRNDPGIPLNEAEQAAMDHYREAFAETAGSLPPARSSNHGRNRV